MKAIPLGEITSEGNRRYTRDEGFEQLVNSIREHGIIEPPVVRGLAGGGYRVIAGRRRIDAVRTLREEHGGKPSKYDEVDCIVTDARDDPAIDEEIALAENVNRQEMHPLDEAAMFARMAGRGAGVEEIARHYARSPSAIYKRLRLAGLTDGLKGLFRDGRLNIAGAAVLAELPEEDQQKFLDLHGEQEGSAPGDGEAVPIQPHAISSFVARQRHFEIRDSMNGCAGCARRTHNEGNELFEEYDNMGDVCLDGECYRRTWKALIEAALAEKINASGMATDAKVWFSGGVPKLLYGKATHVELSVPGEDAPVRFEALRESGWEFTHRETTKKTGACFRIRTESIYDQEQKGFHDRLEVARVGYKQRPPRKQQEQQGAKGGKPQDQAEEYGRETMEALAAERGTTPAKLAKALGGKFNSPYQYKNKIESLVYGRAVVRRIEADKGKKAPARDYLSLFLRVLDDECHWSSSGCFLEKGFSREQQQWLLAITGSKSLKDLAMTKGAQQLFHFLLLTVGMEGTVPGMDELKGIEKSGNLFWDYAGMSEGEYGDLYMEAAREVTAEALKPETKKGKGRKAKTKGGTRTCRVCGCTDDDCSQCIEKTGERCHWVEEDLCSACAGTDDGAE
jgi:ParB/RepB/Spo0J family partition protein